MFHNTLYGCGWKSMNIKTFIVPKVLSITCSSLTKNGKAIAVHITNALTFHKTDNIRSINIVKAAAEASCPCRSSCCLHRKRDTTNSNMLSIGRYLTSHPNVSLEVRGNPPKLSILTIIQLSNSPSN